jgi:methylated-DNA-[protein]-cysteine S-methyltransferase
MNQAGFRVINTHFGHIAVVWSVAAGRAGIDRILLSKPGFSAERALSRFYPVLKAVSCETADILARRIGAFLKGEDIRFALHEIRLEHCPVFQQKVLTAEHAIPRGRVSTYGLIAGHMGHPGAARAVGTALAKNPFPIVIPCHRAVRSDGNLGGYQGGTEMKRALLGMEGVTFRDPQHVSVRNFYYSSK